jgi:hypothetical protein
MVVNENNFTYWYLFIFALFLLSRKSNLVPVSVKKFDSSRQLCRGDITVCFTYLIVRFKWNEDYERKILLDLNKFLQSTSLIYAEIYYR